MTIDYKPLDKYLQNIAIELYSYWKENENEDLDIEQTVDTSKFLHEAEHLNEIEDFIWVILKQKIVEIFKEEKSE